jgi:hypothetical protein
VRWRSAPRRRSGAAVEDASFHERGKPDDHDDLRSRYAERLFAEDDRFWDDRRDARYATLGGVGQPERVDPTPVAKPDRRGWVTWGANGKR